MLLHVCTQRKPDNGVTEMDTARSGLQITNWEYSAMESKMTHGTLVASFPGLPVFFVLQFPLTIIHGCGRAAFRIRVLLSTETEEQKKRGRPGNEASTLVCRWDMGQRSIATHTTRCKAHA